MDHYRHRRVRCDEYGPILPRLPSASVGLTLLPEFIDEHPGGPKILKRMVGKDSTKQFWKYHNAKVLEKYGPKLKIGEVKESAKL